MPKNTVITISGVPGTGTTTIAKLLSKQLDLPLVYTGETFRKLAKEHKMNLEDFSELAKSNPEIDHESPAGIKNSGCREGPGTGVPGCLS